MEKKYGEKTWIITPTTNKILTDENMMETIQHGRSDYPFHILL